MLKLLPILLVLSIIACGSTADEEESDKLSESLIGKWVVVDLRIDDEKGVFKQFCESELKLSFEEVMDTFQYAYNEVEFEFKEDNELVISNSPGEGFVVNTKYKLDKVGDDLFLDIKGSKIFSGDPYQVFIEADDKLTLIYTEWNGLLKLKLYFIRE